MMYRVFFETAGNTLNALWSRISQEFSDLFTSRNNVKDKRPETYYYNFIHQQYRQRFDEGYSVADGDPQRYKFLVERPVYEYYIIYNRWLTDKRREASKAKASMRK